MFELLSAAAITAAAFCWVLPAGALALMFLAIVVLGRPEPPKDGRR